MLKLVKETDYLVVPYDEAVIEAKKIMSDIEDRQWRLGDLADRLEPKYGDQTLAKFAEAIGHKTDTVMTWRTTARAWPEKTIRIGFAVARILNAFPNRQQIVHENPFLTVPQARKLAREARGGKDSNEDVVFPYQEPCTDCSTAQEQWQRSLSNMLGDILSFRSYWDHLFGPEWNKYKLPSSHLTLAAQAKRELISLVASLKEHPHDEEN